MVSRKWREGQSVLPAQKFEHFCWAFPQVSYKIDVTFQRQRVQVGMTQVAFQWLHQLGSHLSTGHPFIAFTHKTLRAGAFIVSIKPLAHRIKCHRAVWGHSSHLSRGIDMFVD